MKLTKELSNKLLQYQLEQFNTCTRSINRELLKGALSNEIETIVHGEVVLRPASTGSRIMCLVNRPQKLDVAAGINDVTLPHGNFLIHEMATHEGVLFNLGDGNHEVIGVLNKPNQFLLSEGYQYFTGDNQRDCFILSLSAEALQRQIDRAMVQQQFSDSFSPPYRLEGDEGVNQLIIQSEFPQPSTGEPSEPPYIGYYVDLKLGRVWLRQYNPEDPEQPKDQALLLMTLRNINQLEIRSMSGTHSVIKGSDAPNIVVLHGQDTLYTGGAHDTIMIQGGVTVHSQSGGKRYVISDQVNQLGAVEIKLIEAPSAAPSTIHLPVDHHQLTEWCLVNNDLVVGLGRQAQSCQLILKGVYQTVNHQRCLVQKKMAPVYS